MSDDDSAPRKRVKRTATKKKIVQEHFLWPQHQQRWQQQQQLWQGGCTSASPNFALSKRVIAVVIIDDTDEPAQASPATAASPLLANLHKLTNRGNTAWDAACAKKQQRGERNQVDAEGQSCLLEKAQHLECERNGSEACSCHGMLDQRQAAGVTQQQLIATMAQTHIDSSSGRNSSIIACQAMRRRSVDTAVSQPRLGRMSLSLGRALKRKRLSAAAAALPVLQRTLGNMQSPSFGLPAPSSGRVLRLVGPQGKTSPCVVVRDMFGDRGLALVRLLEQQAYGGIKRLKSQASAHARGHPQSRRHVKCPGATEELFRIADLVRHCAGQLVADASLFPSSTEEQRRAAQRELSKQGKRVDPYGLMYHSAYPGLCNHVDKGGGRYMVLFNLGLSSTFHCGSTRDAKFDFEFRSGDAVVFNDGNSHGALHGMPRIHAGTAPDVLPRWLCNVRVGLQFRQSKAKPS